MTSAYWQADGRSSSLAADPWADALLFLQTLSYEACPGIHAGHTGSPNPKTWTPYGHGGMRRGGHGGRERDEAGSGGAGRDGGGAEWRGQGTSWTFPRKHGRIKSYLNRTKERDKRLTSGFFAGRLIQGISGILFCWAAKCNKTTRFIISNIPRRPLDGYGSKNPLIPTSARLGRPSRRG